MMKTTQETIQDIASAARNRRLALKLTQVGLEQRSGVSLGTIKKFEHTGKISLESLLKLAVVLGDGQKFETLFAAPTLPEIRSLDELLKKPKIRKRGVHS